MRHTLLIISVAFMVLVLYALYIKTRVAEPSVAFIDDGSLIAANAIESMIGVQSL